MSNGIDLNKSEDYVKEFKIFNDGVAGVVENVKVTIVKKSDADTDSKKPVYKVIAEDGKGSVNEGFYYQEPDSKGFNNYQAQRLIMLAKGVFGDNVVFPVWNTPKEVLDGVMNMVAAGLNRPFRVAVCYGTTKNPDQYLNFKAFGSFIQPMSELNKLSFNKGDNMIKATAPTPTPAETLISKAETLPNGNPANLDWMK
jgi:hypothetical protein